MTAKVTDKPLATYFAETLRPALGRELGLVNLHAIPRITKVTVSVGVGQIRAETKKIEALERALAAITGQQPVRRTAKKSIASFKLRAGELVGLSLTLRGRRMYHFLERLIRIALPRVRDFRGIPRSSLDGGGNLSLGIRELAVFPEIRFEDLDLAQGLAVTITTTARTDAAAASLLDGLGMPFQK